MQRALWSSWHVSPWPLETAISRAPLGGEVMLNMKRVHHGGSPKICTHGSNYHQTFPTFPLLVKPMIADEDDDRLPGYPVLPSIPPHLEGVHQASVDPQIRHPFISFHYRDSTSSLFFNKRNISDSKETNILFHNNLNKRESKSEIRRIIDLFLLSH